MDLTTSCDGKQKQIRINAEIITQHSRRIEAKQSSGTSKLFKDAEGAAVGIGVIGEE